MQNSKVRSQGSVAVLKGFVFGVNWNTPNHSKVIQEAINDLKHFDAIAWDGDLLKKDSFTRILLNVMMTYPNKRYIAFKKKKSAKNVTKTLQVEDRLMEKGRQIEAKKTYIKSKEFESNTYHPIISAKSK